MCSVWFSAVLAASSFILVSSASAKAPSHVVPAASQLWREVNSTTSNPTFEPPTVVTSDPLLGQWHLDPTPDFWWGFSTNMSKLDVVSVIFAANGGVPAAPLFENVVVTASSVGQGYLANASNDPDFASAAQLMSDGVRGQFVNVQTGLLSFGYAGANHPDTYWAPTAASADFAGYRITGIELYLNNAVFVPGSMTNFQIDRYLRFYGVAVPEPTTVSVFAAAMIGVSRRRRAQRV